MLDKRKELKLAYKLNPPPKGVYQIKNRINGKIFIGSNMNLPGSRNSYRFQLNLKCHRNKALQEDWDLYGADAFTFDILETLKTEEIPKDDWRDALSALEDKWLNNLQPYGERGYNKEKKSKEK
ncbi:MAG: excinuclease ABC subunit C [Peptococcaceae bacterium BRH_c4b]|nr:MAG: excinuclease ABC subunit C [Peptococcaceae bacterium BRH_c4b]